MEEAIARAWASFISRLDGPMHLRLIVQPAVATFLAMRAGVRDARTGERPFLAVVFREPLQRGERLRHAWSEIGKVFLLAVALDAIYQISVHASINVLELVATGTFLALVPYVLVRGTAARIARALLAPRGRKARRES